MTEKYINILKSLNLTKVEKDLLKINQQLINIPDRQNLNLDFVRKIGEEGIESLLLNVNFRISIENLFKSRNFVSSNNGECLTIYRFM